GMSGSARPPLTSLTSRAPASRAAWATSARMVSTLTGTFSLARPVITGITRRSSSSAVIRWAPGLVDSPPTSTMSAPSAASCRPRAIAAPGPNHAPPSENESGVTFTTPMIRHRPGSGRPGGPWPRGRPAGQPAPGGDPAGVPLVTVVTLCSQGDIDTADWRPGTGPAADTGAAGRPPGQRPGTRVSAETRVSGPGPGSAAQHPGQRPGTSQRGAPPGGGRAGRNRRARRVSPSRRAILRTSTVGQTRNASASKAARATRGASLVPENTKKRGTHSGQNLALNLYSDSI